MNIKQGLVKSSFFDSVEKSSNFNKIAQLLWITQEAFEEQFQTKFEKVDKGDLIFSGVMCKQDESQEIQEYLFELYNNYLVQLTVDKFYDFKLIFQKFQKNPQIIAIMHLLFVKVEYQEENSNEDLPFLLFSRNQKFEILVPASNKSLQKWLQYLRSRCIMACFSQKYQNIKIIGKGTFAKVMLCTRNEDSQQFAVKIFDKNKIKASKNIEQTILGIHNEIKLMWQLKHKNIIRLHEVYEGEFHVYLVLDLLTGGELFTKLQTKDNYSENDAYELMSNLLSSLDYLHSKGIMHRDIKPENLILKNEETETEIMLADFGLSEHCSKDKLLFKKCGTPGYVAPEILNNEQYDTKVDIFSAGIIFYIILTGYAPFYGAEYQQILEKNKQCKICYDFEQINVNLSPEAIDLLKLMLKPNPQERITANGALNHPWIQKFKNQETNKQISKFSIHFNSQRLKNQYIQQQQQYIKHFYKSSKIIKQTRPQKQDSNDLIMNSPIITGNTNEIQSPYNDNSPQILNCSPDIQKKQLNFPESYKNIIDQIIENGQKSDQSAQIQRRSDSNKKVQKAQPYIKPQKVQR